RVCDAEPVGVNRTAERRLDPPARYISAGAAQLGRGRLQAATVGALDIRGGPGRAGRTAHRGAGPDGQAISHLLLVQPRHEGVDFVVGTRELELGAVSLQAKRVLAGDFGYYGRAYALKAARGVGFKPSPERRRLGRVS